MAGELFVALIDKQALLVKWFWVYAILSHIDLKQLASFRFQLNLAVTIALAQYGQRFSVGIKVIQIQGCQFTGTHTGVIKQLQDTIIAQSLRFFQINGVEYFINFIGV